MSARQNPISEQAMAPPYEFVMGRLLQETVNPFLRAGGLPRAEGLSCRMDTQLRFPPENAPIGYWCGTAFSWRSPQQRASRTSFQSLRCHLIPAYPAA